LKINHFAKDCCGRKEKGHAIPLANIDEGLYNDDYFTTLQVSDPKNPVDSMHSVRYHF
jgi:hypothetical protein